MAFGDVSVLSCECNAWRLSTLRKVRLDFDGHNMWLPAIAQPSASRSPRSRKSTHLRKPPPHSWRLKYPIHDSDAVLIPVYHMPSFSHIRVGIGLWDIFFFEFTGNPRYLPCSPTRHSSN